LVPWLAAAVWAALIFFFSAQPNLTTNLGIWDFILRKLAHMAEFGILCLLLWRAVRQHMVRDKLALVAAGLLALAYAASDEFHQGYVPGRTASIRDVLIDLAGIFITVSVVLSRRKRQHKSLSQ